MSFLNASLLAGTALVALPMLLYPVYLMKIFCLTIFAASFNFLLGFAGIMSFGQAALFGVGLSFGGVPASLVVPLDAVVGFADPYVRFGLRFQPIYPGETDASPPRIVAPLPAEPTGEATPEKPVEAPQVVSLDAFRRRTPPKE